MFSFIFMVVAMLNYDSIAGIKGQPMSKFEANAFGNKAASSWFHNSQFIDNLGGDGMYSWVFGN